MAIDQIHDATLAKIAALRAAGNHVAAAVLEQELCNREAAR